MSHELYRLLSSVVNKPQLATQQSLDFAIGFLKERSENPQLALVGVSETPEHYLAYNPDKNTGVISIDGPLTYVPYYGMCGEQGCSYQRIQSDFDQMVSLGAKTIVLDIDSPGGEAYGAFETANYLRKTADEKGIKLVAYVDGLAASAGYALAVAAHEVITNPFSEVGSIGVVVSLANISKAEKRIGIERSYVFAGDSKIPYDADGNFSKEFLNDLQEKVDTLYVSFVEHVSEMRNLSQDDVKNTKAKTFMADKSLSLGLVDAVMEREEFFTYLSDTVESGNTMSIKDRLFGRKDAAVIEGADVAELKEMQEQIAKLSADFEGVQTQLTAALAKVEEITQDNVQLTGLLSAAEAKLADINAAEEAAKLAAYQAKMDTRKAKLTEVLGDEEGEALFQATSGVEDAAFDLMIKGMQKKLDVEKETPMFKEVGVGGEGVVQVIEEDATTKALKLKYKKQ